MNILFEQKELFRNLRCEITVDKKNNKNVINNNSKNSKIIKEIEYYINVFFPKQLKKLTNMSDISSSVQEFVSEISISFLSINNIEQPSVSQIENAIEAFESLLIKALYSKLIELLGDESKFDRLLHKYSFLSLNNLGIELPLDKYFEFSKHIKIFGEISEAQTPKEKMNHITNICRYILSNCGKEKFIQALMYSMIISNADSLKMHIRFVSLFRNKTLFTSEEEYYLYYAFKAIEAIESLNVNMKSYVNLSQEKFKELSDNYEKKELFDNLTYSNGHFTNNLFIDDRFLALINSEKEKNNNESYDLSSNENNIELLKKKYMSRPFNKISINEMKEIQNVFNNLVSIVKKVQSSIKEN